MEKSLVALAILATAGVASAQSSVTMSGFVDAALQHGSGSGVGSSSRSQLGDGAHTGSSRLRFRGTEDLGGGVSASFWLEARLSVDNGSGALTSLNNQVGGTTGGGGLTFNRRSTVSLASGMGELRLGRTMTPTFLNLDKFDPFATSGVGASQTFRGKLDLGGQTALSASNSISYFLPGKLGGVYGGFQHYLGENAKTGVATQNDGNGSQIHLGYANGPIDVALATSSTTYARTATTGDIKHTNLGGSYNFGVAKAMASITRDGVDRTTSLNGKGSLIGVQVPMGAGQIRASYSRYETDAAGKPESKKFALGYVYNLSKRTLLYTTFARVTNSGGAAQALNGAVTSANQNSTGYDFGLKHLF